MKLFALFRNMTLTGSWARFPLKLQREQCLEHGDGLHVFHGRVIVQIISNLLDEVDYFDAVQGDLLVVTAPLARLAEGKPT